MPDPISQKIVVNMKAGMPIGRLAAQIAHASWLPIIDKSEWHNDEFRFDTTDYPGSQLWLKDQFTKVCLRGWGDEMLLEIKAKAEEAGLLVGLMEEDGFCTALAVGPGYTDEIDKILKPYALPLL